MQISDTEVGGWEKKADWGKSASDHLQKNPVSFVLVTGDLSANTNAGLDFLAKMLKQKRWNTKIYTCIGNHDFTESKPSDLRYRELFGPLWYSFDVKGVHFAVTPMIWSGRGLTAARPVSYTKTDFLKWLKKDLESLKKGTPVILVNHDCLLNDPEICRYLELERFNIKAFLCGHMHFNRKKIIAGIPVYTTSCFNKGGNGSPGSFAVYELKSDGTLSRKVYFTGYPGNRDVADPHLKWRTAGVRGNCIFAPPVLWRDTVLNFVADEAEARNCGVYAYDRTTGKQKWYFQTENSLKSGGAIYKDMLFVCDIDENLYSIDLEKGSLRWKRRLRKQGDTMYTRGCVVYKDTVIAGCGNSLICLRCTDGSVLWDSPFSGKNTGGYGYLHTLCGNILLTGGQLYQCAGIDARTGKLLWQISARKGSAGSPPVQIGSRWSIIQRDGSFCRFDPVTGKISSRRKMQGNAASLRHAPILWDNVIVAGSRKNGLLFYAPDKMKVTGTFSPGKAIMSTTPYFPVGRNMVDSILLIRQGKLIFAGADGKIYCLVPGSRTPEWIIDTGDGVAGMTLAGDELYVSAFSGKLIRYQLK